MSTWYRLDSNARVFPAVTSENNSVIFRVAVILKKEVDPEILQQAADIVIERFPMFKVKLDSGLFWNYLYDNRKPLKVQPEQTYPCAVIDPHENNGYLLRIIYYQRRFALEIFHGLTDGLGALEFFKTLVYQYLLLMGKDVKDENMILLPESMSVPLEAEDSYRKYYQKVAIGRLDIETPHIIEGTLFDPYGHHTTQIMVPASALIKRAKAIGTTLTVFITSLLIQAIYLEESKHKNVTDPIIVGIPVNLRRIFPSITLRNFYVGTRIIAEMSPNKKLEDIINLTEKQLQENLTQEHLQLMLALGTSIRFERLPLKLVPLFIKNKFTQQIYKRFGSATTINLSNMGKVQLPKSMEPYIDKFELVSYPKEKTPINCAMGTVYDQLNITFVRNIREAGIIDRFCQLLTKYSGLHLEVYTNNWGADTSKNTFYPDYGRIQGRQRHKSKSSLKDFFSEWEAKIHI